MQVGGNKQMNDFLASHGVSKKSPIKKKYNSSAAALYREIISAKIEGREPPTALPESPVDSNSENDEVEEDPIQREIRLRAEAKERLNKKFGPGGLAKQAVGSSPIPPGGYGHQAEQSGDDLSKMLSSFTDSVKKTLQDAKISETFQSGVNSVKTKLNDPNLQNEVKEKAQAGWSWLSSTAGSLWSAAKDAASSIVNDLNEENGSRPVSTPRPAAERAQPASVEKATEPVVMANSDIEDDDWMEAELKKAKENLKIEERERTPVTPTTPTTSTTPKREGLKITNDEPSDRRRHHHSHHHSRHGHKKPLEVSKQDLDNWLNDDDDEESEEDTHTEQKKVPTSEDFFAEFGV